MDSVEDWREVWEAISISSVEVSENIRISSSSICQLLLLWKGEYLMGSFEVRVEFWESVACDSWTSYSFRLCDSWNEILCDVMWWISLKESVGQSFENRLLWRNLRWYGFSDFFFLFMLLRDNVTLFFLAEPERRLYCMINFPEDRSRIEWFALAIVSAPQTKRENLSTYANLFRVACSALYKR